jgi:hypothetical protein
LRDHFSRAWAYRASGVRIALVRTCRAAFVIDDHAVKDDVPRVLKRSLSGSLKFNCAFYWYARSDAKSSQRMPVSMPPEPWEFGNRYHPAL